MRKRGRDGKRGSKWEGDRYGAVHGTADAYASVQKR